MPAGGRGAGLEEAERRGETERREETKSDGTRAISYRNGSVNEMLPDARVVCVFVVRVFVVCVFVVCPLLSAKGLNAIKQRR